jgi:hypothetical protein
VADHPGATSPDSATTPGEPSGGLRDRPAVLPSGRDWHEQWTFDAVSADATLAVSVGVGRRVDRHTNARRGWYWMVVAGRDRICVAVVDPDVALTSAPASLEYRSPGLWADHNCTEPGGHWSVAAEAFGVALTDPWDIWGRAFGDPTAVGADLEWDPEGPPVPAPGSPGRTDVADSVVVAISVDAPGAWSVGCSVHGELLVGDERHELDCLGVRGHQWGAGALWPPGWLIASWPTPTGTWVHHSDPQGAPEHLGSHHPGPAHEGPPYDGQATANGAGAWTLTTGEGATVSVQVISWAPVLDGGTSDGRLVMAVARFTGSDANGRDCGGLGWLRYRQR